MTAPMPETIAAVATPPGRGGVGIVRVSGPDVPRIAIRLLGGVPPARKVVLRLFRGADGRPIDQGIALYFPAPHSYTGEDVLELQGHGGSVVMDMLLNSVLSSGARPARPGEFSERAFLNGKLDLSQAEAVADLIESATEQAARSAYRSLQGDFSRRIHSLVAAITELRTYVEAAIDFAEEELDLLSNAEFGQRLGAVRQQQEDLLAGAYQGCLLRDGMTLVIAGQPNVGKSSLMNALAGRESAIVTEIPGTTRDVLREQVQIDGMPLHILDTAGLRDTEDAVERIGVDRAWQAIAEADAILLVVDDQRGFGAEDRAILARLPSGPERLLVHNKIDLTGHAPLQTSSRAGDVVYLSAKTGEGIIQLRQHLTGMMGYAAGEGMFLARRRHVEALRHAAEHIHGAYERWSQDPAGELVAEELRLAQRHLGEITGEVTPDDLLGRIFSSFCIGK